MSDNEKPLDLNEIETRLASTTGPWQLEIEDKEGFLVVLGTARGKPRWSIFALKDEGQADIDFIGNSYTDIAALLQRVRELEAENKTRFTNGAKETKERVLSAIDMAGLMETKFGSKDAARVIAEIKLLVQSITLE